MLRTYGSYYLKTGMVLYPNPLHNWLDFSHALLLLLVLWNFDLENAKQGPLERIETIVLYMI